MSRIGKRPVQVPKGVTASVDGQKINVKRISRANPLAAAIKEFCFYLIN